jgi:RimJ/RimL family protein N-acetyltransferase
MDKVTLKQFLPSNIQQTFVWVKDKEFQQLFTMRGEPNWETHKAYFNKILSDDTQVVFAIYDGCRHIGNCGLKNLTGNNGELWIYIGYRGDRGKGYGKKACQQLLEIAFNVKGLHLIYLHVLESNVAAASMYKAMGFREVALEAESKKEWIDRGLEIVKMEKNL